MAFVSTDFFAISLMNAVQAIKSIGSNCELYFQPAEYAGDFENYE